MSGPRPPHRRWRRIVAAAVVAVVAAPTAAFAEWGDAGPLPEGPEGSEVEAGFRASSDIALARDGSAWFAWTRTATDNASAQVLVSHRSSTGIGANWGEPVVLATVPKPEGSNREIVKTVEVDVDDAGRPTVAWLALTSTTAQVSTVTLAGDAWTDATAFAADPLTLAPIDYPLALDVTADGSAALAWQADDGTHLARRSGTAGWGAEQSVDPAGETAKVADAVGLGTDKDGRVTLVWRGWDETSGAWDVRARAQSQGGTWQGEVATLADDVPVAARPGLAVDSSGSAATSLSTGSANAVADPTTAATYRLTAGKGAPSATFDPYGTATVVWPEVDPTPRIALATVSPTGAWSETETVAETPGPNYATFPRASAGRDGQTTVLWTRGVAIVAPSITGGEIYATARDGDGWGGPRVYVTPQNGSFGSLSALGMESAANLSVANDALGDVAAGWTPYATTAFAGVQQYQAFGYAGQRTESLEWTARAVGGSGNVNSWLSYLRTDWGAGGAACPQGLHGVEVSDGAAFPGAGDDASWRFAPTDAYLDGSGRTVLQYAGTLRWVLQAHCIDVRITNPRLEIAADGLTARLYADGQTSGSMSDAVGGNPQVAPFTNLRILDVDLTGAGPRITGDTRSWLAAPATLAAAGASVLGLETYAGKAFGHLTVVAPTDVQPRPTDPGTTPPPTGGDGGATNPPAATPGPLAVGKPVVIGKARLGKRLTATVTLPAGVGPAAIDYQWLAGKRSVKGATGATLKLTKKRAKQLLGKRLRVRVTIAATGYTTTVVVSARTAKVRR